MADPALDTFIDASERLGVVGSPSSTTEIVMDVLGSAVDRKLVGELALFRFPQDGVNHYALGQITEVQLRNVWHEDPTMRSLIRQRGRVDAVSERQDTHLAQMTLSAVFRAGGPRRYEPSLLGTVPSTGTHIHLVEDALLDELLSPYREEIVYLGRVYGSTPKLPMWFKHFGTGADGAGEAYHLGIFGKSGSGKSVLAKLILLAYARHKDMGIIVLDPQGEFARDVRTDVPEHEGLRLPMKQIIERQGRKAVAVPVSDLVLDRWDLFEEILFEAQFFGRLAMNKNDNRRTACSEVREHLQKQKVKLSDLQTRAAFDEAWARLNDPGALPRIYKGQDARSRFVDQLQAADTDDMYESLWLPVAQLFNADRPNAQRVGGVLDWALSEHGVLVLDLSERAATGMLWTDKIQALVIAKILDDLTFRAERAYDESGVLNSLVLIDEAHRLAPREAPEDEAEARVRKRLIDSVRTTRKYGLGWMFISQTLASLHREIIQQLRIMFFGFGLSLGQEFVSLQQLVGSSGSALDLYRLFRDPHSAFDVASRQYSFMTIGPASPLSFAGTPLFLSVFNQLDDFYDANPSLDPRAAEAAR